MTQSTNKGVTAIKILDDGTAQVLQVDSVGGFMVNTKKGGEIIKFNLCQDLPIMEDPTRTGFSYVQKKVISRLVMTPSALKDLAEMLNEVLGHIQSEQKMED